MLHSCLCSTLTVIAASGFDFAANFNKKVGDVDLQLGVTGTYYNPKATKRDEMNAWDYQNRSGQGSRWHLGVQNRQATSKRVRKRSAELG